ncbi:flavin reductase family protein [Methyloraptor flagellatus]|jgi:flavin reductase (DIM6/NTAB) family NADH-FMN oxidoreductase RutF|uniref:Flavin reductase family protein n=1 Tax=Methyloraptor flagellatus TaxID=3162530 RepID=A0AAU7XCX9_9HYPH
MKTTALVRDEPTAPDPILFREAMSRVAAAVHIVTTDGPAGRGGTTMTAVASVTDQPPTLLVCLARQSRLNAVLKANGVFAVNTLGAGAERLADVFAGRIDIDYQDRFGQADWTTGATGAPLLGGARVAFDCVVAAIHEVGTHTIVFGEIRAVSLGDASGALLYADRAYRTL